MTLVRSYIHELSLSSLRELCEYTWVNGIPHKFVMRSYVDKVIKLKNTFQHNTA